VDLQNEWLIIGQHYIIPLHCYNPQLAKLVLLSFSVTSSLGYCGWCNY